MKKTLIAFMALAGVASADITGAELDSWLTDALSDRQGAKYTLTFTLSDSYNFYVYGGYAPIFTLNGDGWKLIHQEGKYIGLADSTSADDSRTIELQRDTFIEPNGLNFGYDNAKAFKSASIKFDRATYTIPEPTTATLSLLALAGLAARRRRH